MELHVIEVTDGIVSARFAVGRFTQTELVQGWAKGFVETPRWRAPGLDGDRIAVWDLQTCEGGLFEPSSILPQHWPGVKGCPFLARFLQWLFRQDLTDLSTLPKAVALLSSRHNEGKSAPTAPPEMALADEVERYLKKQAAGE